MKKFYIKTIIFFIFFILFLWGNGKVNLFDWDEINFAECSREMMLTGNYAYPTIAFHPFYEKPPFFFWLQVLCMHIFGIGEFAARFPNALAGFVTLILLSYYGKKLFSEKFSWYWPLMYISAILPFLYFKSGIIDPVFNLFMFISVMEYYIYENTLEHGRMYRSSFFLFLAVLTKGPVAILIVTGGIFLYIFISHRNIFRAVKNSFYQACPALVLTGVYLLLLWTTGNGKFLSEFLRYQLRLFYTEDSGHGGPFWFHLPVVFFGCFPASFFAIKNFFQKQSVPEPGKSMHVLMLVLLCWVLLIFSVVKTKIIHYSSFCYFPVSWLAANYIVRRSEERKKIYSPHWVLVLLFFLIMFGLVLTTKLNTLMNAFLPQINDPLLLQTSVYLGKDNLNFFIMALVLFAFSLWMLFLAIRGKFSFTVAALSYLTLIVFSVFVAVPRIELISQRGLIEIFKSLKKYDVYTETINFKTYTYFFYSERKPHHYFRDEIVKRWNQVPGEYNSVNLKYLSLLLNENVSRPVVFVYKGNDVQNFLKDYSRFRVIPTHFGYTLLIKNPSN